MNTFDRVKLLIGNESFTKIKNASIALFGVGGVGGFVAEALVRSGVEKITIIDNDTVSKTNINRQIIATLQSVGKDKVEVFKERLLSINPNIVIKTYKLFYLPENSSEIEFDGYDYIIDAVDTVSAKIEIVLKAKKSNVPVISCMGTGGKLEIEKLKVADIYSTKGCPLARVMRRELKARGVTNLKVVYSEEQVKLVKDQGLDVEKKSNNHPVPPSMIFVPATAGLMIAREVLFDIIKGE